LFKILSGEKAEKRRSHLTATLNYKTKGSKYQSVNATHYI